MGLSKICVEAAVGMLLVAGCSSPDAELRAWLGHDPQRWQLSDGTAIHRAGTLIATAPDEETLLDDTGAEDYVRLALRDNPTIRAALARVRRLEARIPQVTSLEDPQLEVAPFGEGAETVAGTVGLMMGLSQQFPFPGKLDAKGRIAQQEVAVARQELEQARLDVAAEVREAYWSYYFATRALEVGEQSRDLLEQLRATSQSLYEANRATQQDVLRATVQLGALENELTTLRQTHGSAMAMLNSLMDRPIGSSLPPPREVSPGGMALELDDLLTMAAASNPALGKLHRRIEADRQRVRLAKLQRWPDVAVVLAYNLVDADGLSPIANGKDQWGVGFVLNVPIWLDKLRAGEREAYAGMQESIAELTAARNRVAYQVQDAFLKVRTQQRLVALFRDRIIPQANQAVNVSVAEYQAGRLGSLALIDHWRNLLNYQLLYHQGVADLEKNHAHLQRAVGRDLPRAVASTSGPATRPIELPRSDQP